MKQGTIRACNGPIGSGVKWRRDQSTRRSGGRRGRRGLSIIEITITLSVLTTVLLGFSQALVASMVASRTNREASLAADGARQIVEQLQGDTFSRVFAAYNSTQADDPLGDVLPAAFTVAGLQPQANDPDGQVGRIIFPESADAGGAIQLREDLQDFALGMPRDLNGDGVIDAGDHSDDYAILPLVVRVEWRGSGGPAVFQYKILLSDF